MDDPLRISLGALCEGIVVDRPNRFVAVVRLTEDNGIREGGEDTVLCHVADTGRLKELIFPGNKVMVRKAGGGGFPEIPQAGEEDSRREKAGPPQKHSPTHGSTHNPKSSQEPSPKSSPRKTSHDLVLASAGPSSAPVWVSVDTGYPNKLFGQALRARALRDFAGYDAVRSEYPLTPRSRLDFYLEGANVPPALVEVKSVTLCVDGVGLFPDAPTERGARHLRELMKAAADGFRACAVFIAQRYDITKVSPNKDTDPEFARTLEEAGRSGVCLLAYRCQIQVTSTAISLDPCAIPVEF